MQEGFRNLALVLSAPFASNGSFSLSSIIGHLYLAVSLVGVLVVVDCAKFAVASSFYNKFHHSWLLHISKAGQKVLTPRLGASPWQVVVGLSRWTMIISSPISFNFGCHSSILSKLSGSGSSWNQMQEI